MWAYRRVSRKSLKQFQPNSEVMGLLGVKIKLMTGIKDRQMKYFCHSKRYNTIMKTILEGKIERKRERGRQR